MDMLTVVSFVFINFLTYGCCKSSVTETKNNDDLVQKNSSSPNTLTSRPQSSASSVPVIYECKNSNMDISLCPNDESCHLLRGDCLDCDFNCTCIYGQSVNVTCTPIKGISCSAPNKFSRETICRYCYQTPHWQHECSGSAECPAVGSPRKKFKANCTVYPEIICLGNRTFPKLLPCNWTSGYRWSTVLALSITLGGFGADRFYLGHWKEGIGKLLSFGGLGVWTIIDVILIFIRYLGPANESLYMNT